MKFRVFYDGTMYEDLQVTFCNDLWWAEGDNISVTSEFATLMFGLPVEDKNGQTIFESDILLFNDGITGVVTWDGYAFGLKHANVFYDYIHEDWDLEHTIVVGNTLQGIKSEYQGFLNV